MSDQIACNPLQEHCNIPKDNDGPVNGQQIVDNTNYSLIWGGISTITLLSEIFVEKSAPFKSIHYADADSYDSNKKAVAYLLPIVTIEQAFMTTLWWLNHTGDN